ncbi:MAG: hypothetical protein JNL85_09885 [Rubrivivax sp.]|nr:hypothetical protein [Rubrivivax sp.]
MIALPLEAPGADPEKAYRTLQAQFALRGTELVKLADGSFIAARWGLVRPLATLAEAEAFLVRIGGAPS